MGHQHPFSPLPFHGETIGRKHLRRPCLVNIEENTLSTDERIHPYFRAILKVMADAGRPAFHTLAPAEARATLRAGLALAPPQPDLPILAEVVDTVQLGPHGDIPVRRYVPVDPRGICVYFHGGGWVIGDVELTDAICRRIAGWAGCTVLSVEYRLAPEHPYPQPLDDCFAVLRAAGDTGEPLVVAGDSAGGNLAIACALRARAEDGPAIAGQFLAYPVADHRMDSDSYREFGPQSLLLSSADMAYYWSHYVSDGAERADPLLSPVDADLTGLPPSLIYVAELDPLRDEGLALARRLAESGVAVSSKVFPGMLHGFLSAAGYIPEVGDGMRRATAWLRARLDDRQFPTSL